MYTNSIEYDFLDLFKTFINDLKTGKQLQKNGKTIKSSSVENYKYLEQLLIGFAVNRNFTLRLKIVSGFNNEQFNEEKLYWKNFYLEFTNYLYCDLDHYDNYVGRMIKLLRCFFNYLITEKDMNLGFFYKHFYVPAEDVDIVVLSPERLNCLIYHKELEDALSPDLKKVKDVFVFGCTVALRFGDLMTLKLSNLETINNKNYIKVQSKKTQTFTRVKLPDFAMHIINKYRFLGHELLLPNFNKVYMNKKIKLLMEHYGFIEVINRTRQKRGIPENVYRSNAESTPLRFCDAVTTHTMRRSAITTMLSLGVAEQMVRQISGHAANSKEFYRYVAFAQSFIDNEIDMMYEKLDNRKLEAV